MTKICGVKALPFLALVLVLTVLGEQGQAHPCGSTFFSALIQMIPCRAAVAPFSPIQPSEACCNAVKTLGQPCLCTLVNGPPISGVDRNMALQLPDKCTANFEPCNSLSQNTHPILYCFRPP
uniref:Bifunctional inhibitor/plant lipid transfer protein/seed storage helical domain-containing protein n=1 Tax=Salix viminalis TaxID=40686 RepID=A0A6N2LXC0_SALVM